MVKPILINGVKNSLFLNIIISSLLSIIPFQNASATAAFSRQTGEPCAACHMQSYGPWLTQLGQKFKLDGYVAGNANTLPDILNPLSAEVVASYTNTNVGVPGGTYYSNANGQSGRNNNVMNDWSAIYYTGRVTSKIGSYLQLNINPQVSYSMNLAMADIRYADHFKIAGNDITYGISVNNAPTMSDFWMSTPAWMYPYTNSSATIKPAATPWLNALMGGANTAGATAYTMINNHLYLEAGGYTSQAAKMAQGLGVWANATGTSPQGGLIDGGAPYWRMFLQHTVGPHTMMVGTYGLAAKVVPMYQSGYGTNSYQEYNVDSNYSYMLNADHMLMASFRYSRDNMQMNSSVQQGLSDNLSNNLDTVMLMGMWTYKQTYNMTLAWNKMSGTTDATLYNLSSQDSGCGVCSSANGSPNTNSFMLGGDYIPFGKGTSKLDPYLNLRFSLQYWAYTQFNGAASNYDGNGRNASANNTLYFSTNFMF
ncbi:MAG: cytochrome C [Methylococcales bacterium]|nr:MAG: cytochrome C [Methylococcales bacterium]